MSRILRPKQIYTEKFSCGRSEYYAVHFSDPDFPEPLFPPPKRPAYAESDIDAYIEILAARRARDREQTSEAKKSTKETEAVVTRKGKRRPARNIPNETKTSGPNMARIRGRC